MKIFAIHFAFISTIFVLCISVINGNTDDIKITPEEFCEVKNAMDFTGKVALITGSTSGIGAALVRLLSFLGANVVVTGRNETRLKEVVNDCFKLSPDRNKPLGIALDLSVPGNCGKLVNETVKHFKRIDIMVHCAGIALFGSVKDPRFFESYLQTAVVNEAVAVELTYLCIQHLEKSRGSLVLVSSVAATHPIGLTAAYSASKNALVAFATAVAHDVGPNVRVNVVSPGVTDGTRILRYMPKELRGTLINNTVLSSALQRAAVPLDIAKMIVVHCSDLASYMTGSNTEVIGGLSIKLL